MSSPLKRHEKQELQISPTINQATAEGISFLFFSPNASPGVSRDSFRLALVLALMSQVTW